MIKKPPLSPEQDMAANPADNVWVQANAGTGKTKVLVERLLRILFRTEDVKNSGILCLTYTNAGAGEMRNRILSALRNWAVASDKDLVELLKDVALHKPATADDIAHAREVFFWFIDNPDALKVKTIHSFCEEILRRFPIEAGVSPAWTLVSDMNQRVLLQDAFDRLVNAPDLEPEKYGRVAGAFEHIVGMLSEQRLTDLLEILSAQYKYFFQVEDIERYRKYFVDTARYFMGVNVAPKDDISVPKLKKILDMVGAEIKASKTPASYLTKVFNLTKQYIDKTIDFEKYKSAYLTQDGAPIKLVQRKEFLAGEQERVYNLDQYNINEKVFKDTVALFDLSAAFADIYREIKHQRNLLDFEDLILYTRRLFFKPDMMGWVLSQLDLSLSHILVDEAQDTSPLHWDVLRMLVGDFFVGGDTEKEQHSLFVVGDTKQSIYGFQGADSRAFAVSRDEIKKQIENNLRTIREIPLTQSFRSLSSILYTVDAFFGNPYIAETTGFHNNSHVCYRDPKEQGKGLAEIHGVISRSDTEMDTNAYVSIIADKIKSIIDAGKYKPKDIMVLVQRRNPMVVPLVTALKRRNIEVAGSDRIVLPNFSAIRDLMNLVRFCLNTADDYSLCCVLKSPIFRLTEADIFELCKIKNKTNIDNSDAAPMTVFEVLVNMKSDIYERLKSIVEMAEQMGPYSFFSSILDGGARNDFLSALGPQVIDPLEEFMTICLSYERTQPGTLKQFLKWFITGGSEIKRDINAASGVRVATVHGSKGLEAPVVFLIDTTRVPSGDKVLFINPKIMPKNVRVDYNVPPPWLWVAKDVPSNNLAVAKDAAMSERFEEYYRLLYVAMTRARDELYIYGYTTGKNANEKSWHALLWNTLQTIPDATVENDTIRIIHGK